MLVLSRKLDETLMIGDDVKITVLGIQGNQVRLGIDAPKDISIMREEVTQRAGYDPDNKPDRGNR